MLKIYLIGAALAFVLTLLLLASFQRKIRFCDVVLGCLFAAGGPIGVLVVLWLGNESFRQWKTDRKLEEAGRGQR